jgi:hypothetical protein
MSLAGPATVLRQVGAAADHDPDEFTLPARLPLDRSPGDAAADRAYLILMYEEHSRQARQQEGFRTAWAVASVIVLPALLLIASDATRQFTAGLLVCIVALCGMVMQGKHHERYLLHLRVMRGFRGALADAVRRDIPAISAASRREHNKLLRPFRFISIPVMWTLLYFCAIGAGAWIASRGEAPRFFISASEPAAVAVPSADPLNLKLPPEAITPGPNRP